MNSSTLQQFCQNKTITDKPTNVSARSYLTALSAQQGYMTPCKD